MNRRVILLKRFRFFHYAWCRYNVCLFIYLIASLARVLVSILQNLYIKHCFDIGTFLLLSTYVVNISWQLSVASGAFLFDFKFRWNVVKINFKEGIMLPSAVSTGSATSSYSIFTRILQCFAITISSRKNR